MEKALQIQSATISKSLDSMHAVERKSVELTTKAAEQQSAIGNHGEQLRALAEQMHSVAIEVGALDERKVEKKDMQTEMASVEFRVKDVGLTVTENRNHLFSVENFIEKYLPVRMLAQMSEILREIYPNKDSQEYRRLLSYEENKYNQYNKAIIRDEGQPDLQSHINETRQELTNII